MKEQEKTKLQDFFDGHIHFMRLEYDPSANEWDMKPMEGAKEALINHFAEEQNECLEENLQS